MPADGSAEADVQEGSVEGFRFIFRVAVSIADGQVEVVGWIDKKTGCNIIVNNRGFQSLSGKIVVIGNPCVVGQINIPPIIQGINVFANLGILKLVTEIETFVMVFDKSDRFLKISTYRMSQCSIVMSIIFYW